MALVCVRYCPLLVGVNCMELRLIAFYLAVSLARTFTATSPACLISTEPMSTLETLSQPSVCEALAGISFPPMPMTNSPSPFVAAIIAVTL